jgi:protein-tyrosine phosphatase
MSKIKHIILVCAGNTARSPAAEYLAKYYAKKYNADLYFDSCGFFNAFSYMQPESKEYLELKGIKSSDFRPKILNRTLLEKQDLIITMEQSQSNDIIRNYPQISDIDKKTFTLKEFNDDTGDLDIIDPYYTSYTVYKKVLNTIEINIKKMIKKIIEMNK